MLIFLDLDHVLCDFVGGIVKNFNITRQEILDKHPPGTYDISGTLGFTKSKFFGELEKLGEDFWVNLPTFPYTFQLFKYCSDICDTCILTSPTLDPVCASGKTKWIQKHFGKNFRNYILTEKKHYCARKDRLLIDDSEKNVSQFKKFGGKAILFPTWFNSRYEELNDNFEIVKKEIRVKL